MNQNNIYVIYHPFSFDQEVIVYKDNELKDQIKVSLTRLNDVVYGLKNKYNIDNIILCGNQDYLSQFKAELLTSFNNDKVKIEIKGE